MNESIRRRPAKPRLRMLRDQQDQPLWTVRHGVFMTTGATPSEAYARLQRTIKEERA